jgi:hypothetical protein
MEGPKWEAADWAVEKFLADLTERDAFDVGLFHNETRWLAKAPLKAEWFNPLTGQRMSAGELTDGTATLTPPASWHGMTVLHAGSAPAR